MHKREEDVHRRSEAKENCKAETTSARIIGQPDNPDISPLAVQSENADPRHHESDVCSEPLNLTRHNGVLHRSPMPQLCRVVEKAKYTARERRYNRAKPQPWIVLKLMVFVTTALLVYAAYVYIGRFCVPIILQSPGHKFTRRGTAGE